MKYIIFTSFILFLTISESLCDDYKLYFENIGRTKHTIGANVNPLLILDVDSVELKDRKVTVVLPRGIKIIDKGFTRTFFAGFETGVFSRFIWVLYLNYKSDTTYLIPDVNCNLDFSDDKIYFLRADKPEVFIEIPNSTFENARFKYKIEKVNYRNEESRKPIENYHTRTDRSKGFITEHSDYWIDETRLNINSCDTIIDGNKVQLGLMDWNCNGLYDDIDSLTKDNFLSDRFLVGDYKVDTISSNLIGGSSKYANNALLEINRKVYEIKHIDKYGKYAIISATDKVSTKLKLYDSLPPLQFRLFDKSEADLQKILDNDKYNLINVWGIWCKPCIEKMPDMIRIDSSFSNKIKIINLHGNLDEIKYFDKIINKSNKLGVTWTSGFLTNEIKKKLYIDHFPQMILIDKSGKIIDFDINLKNLEKLLDTY